MFPPLQDLPTYSADLWDYLVDMPQLPGRKDRDVLVKEAERDEAKARRVKIWDYFFRINPDEVAKPQKRELAQLERVVAKTQKDLNDSLGRLDFEEARLNREREQAEGEALRSRGEQVARLEAERTRLTADLEQAQADAERYLTDQAARLEAERARLGTELERARAEAERNLATQIGQMEAERSRMAAEREKLLADAERGYQEQLGRLEEERARLLSEQDGIRQQLGLYEQQAVVRTAEQMSGARRRKLILGIAAAVGTLAMLAGAMFFLLLILTNDLTENEGALFALCCGVAAVPVAGVSVWQLLAALMRPSQDAVRRETAANSARARQQSEARMQQIVQSMQQLPARQASLRADYEAGRTPQAGRLNTLAQSIEQMPARIEALKAEFAAGRSPQAGRINQLNQSLEQIPARIAALRPDFDAGRTPQATRINLLKRNLEQIPGRIEAAQKQIESGQSAQQQRISQLEQSIGQVPAQKAAARAQFDAGYPAYAERILQLKTMIADLVAQIPPAVSDEHVDGWLDEDIAELAESATDSSGLRDRLIPVLDAENPFCIRGPAELQASDLIPAPYRDRASNRYKHLRARRFVVMPDGSFADFYGVYAFEFILVASDVVATYDTLYDFITGRRSGERTMGQHYADVVTIKTLKGYREVESDNGEMIIMENVPSLSLTLVSGDKIDVTFPDEDYFLQIKAEGFSEHRWRFDPRVAADNAIKVVREKVDTAKKKREFGERDE